MNENKDLAYKLRSEGKSYTEIYKKTGVPKSTLSTWFLKEKWSLSIKNRNIKNSEISSRERILELNRIRKEHLERKYEEAKREAIKDLEIMKNNELFIAGVSIYWGEGDKASKNSFRIANTDPNMIKLFVHFLKKCLNVDSKRIRASIIGYPNKTPGDYENWWRENADLKDIYFTKTCIIKGKSLKNKLSNGICTVSFSSTYLKKKMLCWIEEVPKILMRV